MWVTARYGEEDSVEINAGLQAILLWKCKITCLIGAVNVKAEIISKLERDLWQFNGCDGPKTLPAIFLNRVALNGGASFSGDTTLSATIGLG